MPSHQPLKAGHHDIRSNFPGGNISTITQHLEVADIEIGTILTRVYSSKVSARTEKFRNEVRERDGKCVISGTVNTGAYTDLWWGFEPAHIFPLSGNNYSEGESDSGINSCQNRLLMQSSIHQGFDSFCFAINPDDNYKIVSFDDDPFNVYGRGLDPICRAPNSGRSVPYELLRWHFRQTVIANMRGTGEPGFELDFPPGTDMVGEILSGPAAAKRMEAELFLRWMGSTGRKRECKLWIG
ncbi:hypothetical protein V1527DRAFT_499508 [Lipomyces starkeyi]